MKDINNYDLTSYNTFGIKAFCRRFVEFDSLEELRLILTTLTAGDAPLLILGGGSNLLLTDEDRKSVV